jgi:DNA-binding GntR family transcriptional regulator
MRLELAGLAPTSRPQAAGGANLSGQVYDRIKADLFDFRLLPGDYFTETELVSRLGVSRTPVRQALYRLEREGHVLVHQRAGWQVRPFDFVRFEALYDLRIVLEQAAVERLCARQDMDEEGILAALKDTWLVAPPQRLHSGQEVARLDEDFHCALVKAAGNGEMTLVHREITEKIRIIRRLDFTKDYRVDATYMEHGAILRAIMARREAEARRMLKSHIEMSKAEVRKITLHHLHAARPR